MPNVNVCALILAPFIFAIPTKYSTCAAEANPSTDAAFQTLDKITRAAEWSFKASVKGTTQQVQVQIRDLPATNHRPEIKKVSPQNWLADTHYGRIANYLFQKGCATDAKGNLRLEITASTNKPLVLYSKGLAEDVYLIHSLGVEELFSGWLEKTIKNTPDVQQLEKTNAALKTLKHVELTPELKPLFDIAKAKYDEKRPELLKRFMAGYLFFPPAAELNWGEISQAGNDLYFHGTCMDLMYVSDFFVHFQRGANNRWEYVNILADSWFKGE